MTLPFRGACVCLAAALLLGLAFRTDAATSSPRSVGGASRAALSRAAPTAAAMEAEDPPSRPSTLELVESGEGETMISMGLYGVDIDHLLTMLSTAASVTIVKSQEVEGSVTIIAPEPVPLDVAFQILNSVLEVRGFTIIRSPIGIYKVIPIVDAMKSSVPIRFGHRPEDIESSDALITQVIPLTNLDATSVIGEIRLLLSQQASIVPTALNSIIVTDTSANVERVLQIIADNEAQLSSGLQIFRLQHRGAEELASLVGGIVLGRGAGGAAARAPWEARVQGRPTPARQAAAQSAAAVGGASEFCYPDLQTNSLIVLATPTHLQQIAELVQKLDVPVSLRESYFRYPVQNLVASDLAQLIAPLVNAEVTTATGAGRAAAQASSAARAAAARRSTPAARTTTVRRSSADPTDRRSLRPADADGLDLEVEPLAGVAGGQPAAGVAAPAQPPQAAVQVAPVPSQPPPGAFAQDVDEIAAAMVGDALIAADDNTNILLIAAPPAKLELVRQLLDELDVLPPQVNIRAIIAEIALDRETSLGFQWSRLPQLGPYGGQGVIGDLTAFFEVPTEAASSIGLFGQISAADFEGVLTALTTDNKARILSTPNIFTSNNQPASINISSSRPFPTGQVTSTAGTSTGVEGVISTTIRYEDVGIQLNVTPLVTQGDVVRMNITVNADQPGLGVVVGDQTFPSTDTRQAQAIVHVRDGYTVVLGGLMRESITRQAQRVPLLGDLPIIGPLFRRTTSRREKSELLVFLTPQVVRTVEEAAELTEVSIQRLSDIPRILQSSPADMKAESPEPPSQFE